MKTLLELSTYTELDKAVNDERGKAVGSGVRVHCEEVTRNARMSLTRFV